MFKVITASGQSAVKIDVSGFRVLTGKLYISLYRNQDSFLKTGREITTKVIRVIDSNHVVAKITGLPTGWYAVALYHDEDDNNKMNTGFLGMPREPYGLSNNYRPRFCYPKFTQCQFYVADKEEKDVPITLIIP
jgi:uncharacterized protein (DUF2141 family)